MNLSLVIKLMYMYMSWDSPRKLSIILFSKPIIQVYLLYLCTTCSMLELSLYLILANIAIENILYCSPNM